MKPVRKYGGHPLLALRGREYLRDFGYAGVGGIAGTLVGTGVSKALPAVSAMIGKRIPMEAVRLAPTISRYIGAGAGIIASKVASAHDAEQVRKELGIGGKPIKGWTAPLIGPAPGLRLSTRLWWRRRKQELRAQAPWRQGKKS